jgi:Integrase zinc binding domain
MQVLKLAHDLNHMLWKSTYKRLKVAFWWPTIVSHTKSYVMTCDKCSRRARITVYDRVPIESIERSEIPLNRLFCDACGPIGDTTKSGVYQYFFVDVII